MKQSAGLSSILLRVGSARIGFACPHNSSVQVRAGYKTEGCGDSYLPVGSSVCKRNAGRPFFFLLGKVCILPLAKNFWENGDRYRGTCTGVSSPISCTFFAPFFLWFPSADGQRVPVRFCPSRLVDVLLPFRLSG